MSTVRAKFVCSSITQHGDGSINVEMFAVHSGSEENKAFNDFTPSGSFKMHIAKDKPAQKAFTAGKEYYFDISEAVPPVVAE